MGKIQFNFKNLQEHCTKHNIVLQKDYSNTAVRKSTSVEAICEIVECNQPVHKKIANLLKNGCFCDKHKKEHRNLKFKETCLKNYGVENPSQIDEIKKLKEETCFKNQGVKHPLYSKEVKEKIKKTNLENMV